LVVRRFSALFFDAVLGILIGSFLFCRTDLTFAAAVMISAFYVVLPSFTIIAMGPRSYNLTPRNFAQTSTGVAALLIVASSGEAVANWGVITAAAIFLSLSLISSKFSVQYVVLVLVPASIATASYPAWASIAVAVVLAVLFWRSLFFRQLKGQWLHLEWYYKYGWHFVSHRGNWRRLWDAIRFRKRWIILEESLFFNPLISGVIRHLPVFISLFLVANRPLYGFPIAFLLATVVIWLLTSFGRLRILGEAERYLEQSMAPAWYLLWSTTPPAAYLPMVGFFLLYCIVFFTLNLRLTGSQARAGQRDELASIARVVDRKPQAVVLCSHYDDLPFFLSETSVRVVGINANFSIRGNEESRYLTLYDPFPKVSTKRLPELCDTYAVDFLVWRKEQPITTPHLDCYISIISGDHYALYARKGAGTLPDKQ
jgi:hypothetical protein